MKSRTVAMSLVAAALCGAAAIAQDAAQVAAPNAAPPNTVTLQSGERLQGSVISRTDKEVVLEHPVLGKLTIPAEQVAEFLGPEPPPPPPPPDETWTVRVEAGLNGSEGNTERLNGRLGFFARREKEDEIFSYLATYQFATDQGDETENRFFTLARQEWLFPPGPWSIFTQGSVEIDRFRDYDWRWEAIVGPGYDLIRNETTRLTLRAGLGVAQELGGDDEDVFPLGFAGAEFSHKFDDRNSVIAYYDWRPDLSNFDNQQHKLGAAWEIRISETEPWTLRLGFEDRYDTEPGSAKHNDLDYFVTFGYNF